MSVPDQGDIWGRGHIGGIGHCDKVSSQISAFLVVICTVNVSSGDFFVVWL